MSTKGYYKNLPGGKFLCHVCGAVYDGVSARHEATNCCRDSKPTSQLALKQSETILRDSYHQPTPRSHQPKDGVAWRDKWGHWHRGQKPGPVKTEAEYHRAFDKIERQAVSEQVNRLENIFNHDDIQTWLDNFHRARSPEQTIAYAFTIRNYELMRNAVADLVREAALHRETYIMKHLEEYGLELKNEHHNRPERE